MYIQVVNNKCIVYGPRVWKTTQHTSFRKPTASSRGAKGYIYIYIICNIYIYIYIYMYNIYTIHTYIVPRKGV